MYDDLLPDWNSVDDLLAIMAMKHSNMYRLSRCDTAVRAQILCVDTACYCQELFSPDTHARLSLGEAPGADFA